VKDERTMGSEGLGFQEEGSISMGEGSEILCAKVKGYTASCLERYKLAFEQVADRDGWANESKHHLLYMQVSSVGLAARESKDYIFLLLDFKTLDAIGMPHIL